jgi:UDP-N-acetylglucosamine 3-dehydrogenase
MRKLRVGIIGLGHVAQVCHLPAYKNVGAIEVVAGAELQKNVLNEVSSRWDLKGYDNYEDMLKKEELDIACITTGPKYSPKITERAAEFGVNVLVEKPIALTLEDAKSMIAKCKKEDVKLCYGECFRFFPTCTRAKELIDEGRLGDLFLLMETVIGGQGPEHFSSYRIYPPGAPGAGPMGLTDHGIHLIDVFRWLTRSEVEWVFGRGNRSGEKASTEFLTMKFRNGTIGQLVYNEASYPSDMPYEGIFSWGSYEAEGVSSWESYPANFRVHGTKGALRIFTYPNKLFYFAKDKQEEIRVLDRPHPDHFGLQMESFAKCIADGEEPKVTGIDGLKALQIILAAYESYEDEKVVRIEPAH